MPKRREHDPILLGFGHDYLSIAERIVMEAKQMREEISSTDGIDFPRIHIVDHDYDEEMNNLPLKGNEFIIKIYGEEKFRCESEVCNSTEMIRELRRVIMENMSRLQNEPA